ncbi:hypothetical protein [Sorangium sp. So ce341]|uniref:hypothetical protein n=1 Tax=Sorangium sp. So ce341 TaxID=3133302 RepID=UPI003F63928F
MDHSTEALERCGDDLRTFVRNRYFYGKLLDVHHFESEQSYFNDKRWLLNRLISGFGVVCGLDVHVTDDRKRVFVGPGVALDQAGRELVVPVRSKPIPLPELPVPQAKEPRPPQQVELDKKEKERGRDRDRNRDDDRCDDDRVYHHVGIRWHECESDPELVRVGSACDEQVAPCVPGSVRERYEIFVREGRAPRPEWQCEVAELFSGGRLSYDTLARHVTASCPSVPRHPYIPLADLCLKPEGGGCGVEVDITIRPIVYTNDLLFELLIGALMPAQNRPRGGK